MTVNVDTVLCYDFISHFVTSGVTEMSILAYIVNAFRQSLCDCIVLAQTHTNETQEILNLKH